MNWAYGVTTVRRRRDDYLPATLRSLAGAGFPQPRLFVDGDENARDWRDWALSRGHGDLPVTCRGVPNLRTHGNWILTLYELYIRNPNAQRYAVFQDDFITYKNLRGYLERCVYPNPHAPGYEAPGYWNLYTFPSNQELAPKVGQTGRQKIGWFLSNQFGRGAVALVFSRDCTLELLASRHMVERPMDCHRGWRAVDGGIVTALAKIGWKEYVHNPSLVQHTGLVSAMNNKPHKLANSFRGEDFDATSLLEESKYND